MFQVEIGYGNIRNQRDRRRDRRTAFFRNHLHYRLCLARSIPALD